MWICVVMLSLCLPQAAPAEADGRAATDYWNSVISEDHDTLSGQSHRVQRSPPGHAVKGRAVSSGELTITTLPDNTTVVEDSGKYYTWRRFGPEDQRTKELWVDMSDVRHGQVRVHGILSNSYKQAARVALSFDFPFYGHYLRQMTIATGGFIFTGDVTHRMLTTTQYIAPLMANFDPSYSQDSRVQYLDTGEVFVVQWERVRLLDRESAGVFTFQAALDKTGRIVFSYKDIPLPLDVISSAEHSVKVGLSDAFMVTSVNTQSPAEAGSQRAIFEYHRVEVDTTQVTNNSAIEFSPLPMCLQYNSCELCHSFNQTLGCTWCHVLQRCSDGMDRHRQEWLDYSCSDESREASCSDYTTRAEGTSDSSIAPEVEGATHLTPLREGCETDDVRTDSSAKTEAFTNSGVIAGITAALALLLALVLVALYINCYPSVASPHYLITRRRSYWPSLRFQKQQSGYTEVEEGHEKDSIVEAGPR